MIFLTRKAEFSSAHFYWNDAWSPEENLRVFGKCANRNGHGHNYTLEVTVTGVVDPTSGFPGSPSAVRRGTRRSSSLASPVSFVFSCALPVSAVAFELSGWWLRQVCDLIGSVQPSIRLDHLI